MDYLMLLRDELQNPSDDRTLEQMMLTLTAKNTFCISIEYFIDNRPRHT